MASFDFRVLNPSTTLILHLHNKQEKCLESMKILVNEEGNDLSEIILSHCQVHSS